MAVARLTLCLMLWASSGAGASPTEDLRLYQRYFLGRFPGVSLAEFANGTYAIDKPNRENWIAIEDFPPYAPYIDQGRALWNTPFANGRTYADCFDGNPAQRRNFPRWDPQRKQVGTLGLAINDCRETNSAQPLPYGRGPLTLLLAYMAYESRGQITEVQVPNEDKDALAAYQEGKAFYLRRRGQLNFSCANCHLESAGQHLRSDTIGPSLGQTTGWPAYRSEWGELGTLHRRFALCNSLIRARPLAYQSEQYRNLEYFLTHMSNGIPYNGPSARK